MDIWDTRAVLPHASEFVQLNGRIYNLVSDILGAVDEGSRNWMGSLVAARTDGLVCCTLRCIGGCYMELVTLSLLTLVCASLRATYIFKQGRCIVMCVQRKRPTNTLVL